MNSNYPKKAKIPFLFKSIRWLMPRLESYYPKLGKQLAREIFLRPLRLKLNSESAELEEKAIQSHFDLNGKSIAYYKWGKGPYILLIHGWSSRALHLAPIIQSLLDNGYSVMAPDAYGHGKSEGNKSNVLLMRDGINFLLKKYNVAGMVCHSLGSAAAILSIGSKKLSIPCIIMAPPVTRDAILKTFKDKINTILDLTEEFDNYSIKKFGKPFRALTVETFAQTLHTFPLLIIHDEKDRDSPVSESILLKQILPFSKLEITRGLGHNRILKDSGVHTKIVDFLDKNIN